MGLYTVQFFNKLPSFKAFKFLVQYIYIIRILLHHNPCRLSTFKEAMSQEKFGFFKGIVNRDEQ